MKRGKILLKSKLGQVWVETIIYTLIAFVIIGLVLSFANPQIGKIQDRTIIEQSTRIMEEINTIINSIGVPGNKRLIEISVRKGNFLIDAVGDEIIYQVETELDYSEPGENITSGNVIINTQEKGAFNLVTLRNNYTSFNLTYEGKEQQKTLSKSSTSYKLFITNKGSSVIDFELG